MFSLCLASIAWWVNRISAPGVVARLPDTVARVVPVRIEAAYRLFGIEAGSAASPGNLSLTGVFAAPGGGGFATLRTPKGQVSVLRGGEVMPGVTLNHIGKDHVMLDTGGGTLRLPLTKDAAPTAPAREDR